MNYRSKVRYSKLALGLAVALASAPAFAQDTSATVGGRVTGAAEVAVAGAQVTITHLPSGTSAQAVTDANGRYVARGLRVGGPYRITITKDGETEVVENVFLRLAETTQVNASLEDEAATLEAVEVTASNLAPTVFSATTIGTTTTVTREQLDVLPSIQRDLQDFARLDPRISQTDEDRGEISVAGQNSRFNSITIDGVPVSDTFGLEANNLPTARQPISIDAIEEVQINVANYDVIQRGYLGANINAVTKSGTNDFRGSTFYVFRNDSLAGDRFNRTTNTFFDPPESEDTTMGVTFGGPILKDRLFFFMAYEDTTSTRIGTDFAPLGGVGRGVFITPAEIDATRALAQSRYGIDIGNVTVPQQEVSIEDLLLKLDWNIADNQRASLRYTRTDESTPIFPGFGTTQLSLSSHWYTQEKQFETLVGQWFGDWTDTFSTEFRVSRREYNSEPINNANLPQVGVRFTGGTPPAGVQGGTRTLNFGTERSRHFNELGTTTDDVFFAGNLFLGDHEVKFGLDWQRIDFFNAFLQDTRGNYTFQCLLTAQCANSFEAGRPIQYLAQVPQAGRTLNDGAAQWQLENLGFFLQDTWSVNYNLTLTAGFRVDRTGMPDTPLFNAAAAAPVGSTVVTGGRPRATGGFGLNNSSTLDGELLWQPRFGFNYTFDTERPTQLRGGFGLFQGSAANVWLSNPYSNTGRATAILGCGTQGLPACPTTGTGIFSANPGAQPALPGTPPASNVDFLDENLDQPSVWKANLAFDHELPFWGAVFSTELVLTEVEDGIYYQHLNLGAPTATGRDGRSLFWNAGGQNTACWDAQGNPITTGACAGNSGPIARWQNNASFANVLVARPTNKGRGQNLTLAISRARDEGEAWSWSLAYAYTEAEEVSPLTSSVSNSNWQAAGIFNANEEVAARSPYVVRDRIVGTLGYRHFLFDGYATDFGLFYEGRTGKPYNWIYRNDLNGDGATNDLMYIPTAFGSGEVVFRGGVAEEQAFWNIVNQTGLNRFAGRVVDRYSDFSPWVNSFDMRISQQLPGFMEGHRSELVLDILNVGNLINKDWGRLDEIAFQAQGAQARSFVNYLGRDAQGRYIYGLDPNGLEDFVTRQGRGESQWAAQLTFRYRF